MNRTLTYKIDLEWSGGIETNTKIKYLKKYKLHFNNKPTITGSADGVFHGDNTLYNPEEMLLSALSSCHMMSFFYLCSLEKIIITSYTDTPVGTLKINSNGSGQFEEVILQPTIHIKDNPNKDVAAIFKKAGEYCFIARSCNFKITLAPKITQN